MFTDAAAISSAGIVLSHPPSSTSPSIGLPRNISSIVIAARFRMSMAVGRTWFSPMDGTGMLYGTPPDSHTPCFTLSATSSRWELHVLRSDAVFAIAICGLLPSIASAGLPRRIHARWMYAERSSPRYQSALRYPLAPCSSVIGTPSSGSACRVNDTSRSPALRSVSPEISRTPPRSARPLPRARWARRRS